MKKDYTAPKADAITFISQQAISISWEEINTNLGGLSDAADKLSCDIIIKL